MLRIVNLETGQRVRIVFCERKAIALKAYIRDKRPALIPTYINDAICFGKEDRNFMIETLKKFDLL